MAITNKTKSKTTPRTTSTKRVASTKKTLTKKSVKKAVAGSKKAIDTFTKETKKFFHSLPGMHK